MINCFRSKLLPSLLPHKRYPHGTLPLPARRPWSYEGQWRKIVDLKPRRKPSDRWSYTESTVALTKTDVFHELQLVMVCFRVTNRQIQLDRRPNLVTFHGCMLWLDIACFSMVGIRGGYYAQGLVLNRYRSALKKRNTRENECKSYIMHNMIMIKIKEYPLRSTGGTGEIDTYMRVDPPYSLQRLL